MGTMTWEDRMVHPTTAEVYEHLDFDHCERCETWASGAQAWWMDPNSVQGKEMLDAIGAHFLAHDIGKDKY